jgi:hypothetical protein
MKSINWATVIPPDKTIVPPKIIGIRFVNATDGLRLRATPSIYGSLITTMPDHAQISLYDTPRVVEGANTWANIQYGTLTGWASIAYLTPSPVPPPIPSNLNKIGLHFLQDGRGAAQNALNTLQARNKHLASATVVNDPAFANDLANIYRVPYTIYRTQTGDSPDGVVLPGDMGQANRVGHDWVSTRWNNGYSACASNVYLQFANELSWQPHHGDFWLGAMEECDARNRKMAFGVYAVGNLEDNQIVQMLPAMQYAKNHGHLFVLHMYGKDGNPPGQLTPTDIQDYEARFIHLYAALPATARPDLVFSECACEFHRGKFQGVGPCVSYALAVQKLVTPYDYVKGFNLWTVGSAGGWGDASIDSALPDIIGQI